MSSRLLINGLVYQARNEISPTSPYSFNQKSSGIEIIWSPTDVEIISGNAFSIEKANFPNQIGTRYPRLEIYNLSAKQLRAYFIPGGIYNKLISPKSYPPLVRYQLKHNTTTAPYTFDCFVLDINNNWVSNGSGSLSSNDSSIRNTNWASGCYSHDVSRGLFPAPTFSANSVFEIYDPNVVRDNNGATSYTRVISNSGVISSRRGDLNPQISIIGGCELIINLTDGTAITMTFPTCPTVELLPDEICQNACNLADTIISLLSN